MSRRGSLAESIPQETSHPLDAKRMQSKGLFGSTKRAPYGTAASKHNSSCCRPWIDIVMSAAWHDYEQKYPPDTPYHELGEDSRLWNVYNDEAQLADKELVEENSDSLDILLIFVSSHRCFHRSPTSEARSGCTLLGGRYNVSRGSFKLARYRLFRGLRQSSG